MKLQNLFPGKNKIKKNLKMLSAEIFTQNAKRYAVKPELF